MFLFLYFAVVFSFVTIYDSELTDMQDDDSESSSSSDSEVEQVVKTNSADKFLSLEDDDSPILLRNYENEADNIDEEGSFSISL